MIFWRGAGIVIVFIFIGCFFLAMFAAYALFGEAGLATENTGWILAAGSIASAGLTYGLHWFLTRGKGKTAVDPATGREFVLTTPHELAFIPVRWWPYILLGIALCSIVAASFGVSVLD